MELWRVEVADVSVRYVEAETAPEAKIKVADSILAGIDLHASRADKSTASRYEAAGPVQRKNLLAALDGLSRPRARLGNRRLLRRLQKYQDEIDVWATRAAADMPPIDPASVEALLRGHELRHIDNNMARLHSWTNSPHHARQV